MAVKMYNEGNKLFIVCCRLANTPATWRQWKKWKKNEGSARALKGEPQRLFDAATKNLESAGNAKITAGSVLNLATKIWESAGRPEEDKAGIEKLEGDLKSSQSYLDQCQGEFDNAAALYDKAFGSNQR